MNDEIIPFSVKRNQSDWPKNVVDEDNNLIGIIQTDTNYSIVIDVKRLQLGKEYMICFNTEFDDKWEYCDSDEYTTCFSSVINGWVVGIGAYDPNSQEKMDQAYRYSEKMGYLKQNYIMHPATYDETIFHMHSVETLAALDGYSFKLYDYTRKEVCFEVAWIKVGEYPIVEYESALGLWLC